MLISPGILHSSGKLLSTLADRKIHVNDFLESVSKFRLFGNASRERVLELCQEAQWIQLTDTGEMILTSKGKTITQATTHISAMRIQLQSIIFHKRPPWAKRVQYGRAELLTMAPSEIKQCFDEAGLSEGTDEDTVSWWDILSQASRGYHDEKLLEKGRKGERLSINHERERTGREPEYIALDTAIPGYDILSTVSKTDETTLCIEVKSTDQSIDQAYFHLSKNEYKQAKINENYVIHLWLLNPEPRLLEVPFSMVESHCPVDKEDGEWESVKIPFKSFEWG